MRFPHNAKIFRGQLDAAPFLGVFFLLIIFLLLNSTFVFTPGVPISLPEGVNLPGPDKATAAVAVDEGGHYYFENQLCDEDRLRQRLQDAVSRSQQPITLVVQADKAARTEVLTKLGLLARSLGIRDVLLAVRPPVIAAPITPSTTPSPAAPTTGIETP
ncbi:MAG: biopolymer transporter ExbD [Verrucomicrobia bacterium]|nr:biopolymer transporter ExbD [Verrucomicrobiota bacterium]